MGIDAAALASRLMTRLVDPTAAFEVYEAQRAFVYSDAPHLAFVAGIGSGKSWAGALRGIRAALGQVGSKRVPTPNLGVVTAPTYKMLKDATVRTYIELCERYVPGFETGEALNKGDMILTLPNGSEILFRSTTDPETLRGPSVLWWHGDEGALSPAMARRLMIGRLRQFGELGYEWLTSTPKGRNWVWQVYVRDGLTRAGYQVIRSRTDDNPYLSDEIKRTWAEEYTGDFARQELGGEFVAFEGLIYGRFSHERHVVGQVPDGKRWQRVVAGVDWGYANPGVIVVYGVDTDGRMWQLAEEVERRRRVEEWANVAAQMRETWGVGAFYCDPSEPDYIRTFREKGVKAEAADNRVLPGIQRVQNRLVTPAGADAPRLVISADCVHTLSEIDQYQWASNKHGMKDAPVKANDHTMDAMRYAVMGVDEVKKPVKARTVSYVG